MLHILCAPLLDLCRRVLNLDTHAPLVKDNLRPSSGGMPARLELEGLEGAPQVVGQGRHVGPVLDDWLPPFRRGAGGRDKEVAPLLWGPEVVWFAIERRRREGVYAEREAGVSCARLGGSVATL